MLGLLLILSRVEICEGRRIEENRQIKGDEKQKQIRLRLAHLCYRSKINNTLSNILLRIFIIYIFLVLIVISRYRF